MSTYFKKKRGWWEYFFRRNKKPYTQAGFKTKKECLAAEAERKKEVEKLIKNPKTETIDMEFLDLLNLRLDFLQAYRSPKYYEDTVCLARRWAKEWKHLSVNEVTPAMISSYLIEICKSISANSANKELRCLRSVFNFGINPPQKWFKENPTSGIPFFPVEKKERYTPPYKDVVRVLLAAQGEVRDYLMTIGLTLGRMSEINRLAPNDCDFRNKQVTLYSRKTKNGNLIPRKVPMCETLSIILKRRLKGNDTSWVFYHTYYSRKTGEVVTGPYADRKRIMKTLCKNAGVKYFRFHPLRHWGASELIRAGYDARVVQELLGHTDLKTTQIYIHSIKGADRGAMNLLDSKLRCLA